VRRDLIVLGASAGGVEALQRVVAGLPADLPAAVLVTLHVPPYSLSVLPDILDRAGPLPARHAGHRESLVPGTIRVAPPDHHLVVDDGELALTRGPRENGHRPGVDVLFRTAARARGARVVAVVLSGVLDDGTAGLAAVASVGGATVVQDPADALYSSMPAHALEQVPGARTVAAGDLGDLLVRLCGEDIPDAGPPASPALSFEADMAMLDEGAISSAEDRPGHPSQFSCPDCNGVLWEVPEPGASRFRCRVGHAWSAEALLGQQTQQLDSALWMALRALEEKVSLARTLGDAADRTGKQLSARRFHEQAEDSARAARIVRSMLEAHIGSPDEPVA
jgi:two-component system, chemotaxis family, protein-glutamate methylesterase/glutaminase